MVAEMAWVKLGVSVTLLPAVIVLLVAVKPVMATGWSTVTVVVAVTEPELFEAVRV
jgi:hypothetical protein